MPYPPNASQPFQAASHLARGIDMETRRRLMTMAVMSSMAPLSTSCRMEPTKRPSKRKMALIEPRFTLVNVGEILFHVILFNRTAVSAFFSWDPGVGPRPHLARSLGSCCHRLWAFAQSRSAARWASSAGNLLQICTSAPRARRAAVCRDFFAVGFVILFVVTHLWFHLLFRPWKANIQQ